MFLSKSGELFASIKMHDLSTGKFRIVNSEKDCHDDSEKLAYSECLSKGTVIAVGTSIAEPIK